MPFRRLTKKVADKLLPALIAKYYTEHEIIGSLLTKHSGQPEKNTLLDVKVSYGRKPNSYTYMCGENPHVTARIIGQD